MGLHIVKQQFDGYSVASGVEYPGIIVHAKTDQGLVDKFLKALPGHKEILEKYNASPEISVIST